MVTKKDFKAVAEIIKKQTVCPREDDPFIIETAKDIARVYAKELANYFATQNPRFDRGRFIQACGLD